MTFVLERLDLAELTAVLVGEVRAGIIAAEGFGEGAVQVVQATVRVGQRPDRTAPNEQGAAPLAEPERGPGPVIVRPRRSPIVLQGSAEQAGWEIELSLGRGTSVVPGDGAPGTRPGDALATAAFLWYSRTPRVIKGIDVRWALRLEQEGVSEVRQLLELDEVAVGELVTLQGSHRFLDFWIKAQLLRSPAPRIAASPADDRKLSALAGRPPAALRQLIGPDVCSASAATQLFDLLASWGTALDRRVMAEATLADLRAAVRVEGYT